ncbi:chitin synthase-domain-containing protein [Cokeromyces recurvatus]|uniref:chitin synthase-domain-containing protein n=1 Tax=Cokeromyces recurvatus TaxID=90255 RepID=UPI0022203C52|nr:chitin synthase-domain-containing protein [Cokeromyces recurvatus]KAI7901849.1 chitin synthase-domain-containing protein [Cokeromyces recurvatus]
MSVKNYSNLRRPTCRRLIWIQFSQILTFFIPNFILTYVGRLKTTVSRKLWREKIAFLFLYLILAAFFCFSLEFLSSYFCDPEKTFEYEEVFRNESKMSAIHGKVIDWRHINVNSSIVNWVNKYPHHDLSANFPRFMMLSRSSTEDQYQDNIINECIYYQNKSIEADAWLDHLLLTNPGYKYDKSKKDHLSLCPLPNQYNVTGAPCFYGPEHNTHMSILPIKGDIQYDPDDVAKLYDALPSADNSTRQAYVILDGYVLDVTTYLSGVTNIIPLSSAHSSRSFALNRMFLPLDLTIFLYINLGKDITNYFEGNVTENPSLYRNCLIYLFRKGITPSYISSDCRRINPALWATMGVGFVYFLTKMSLVYLSRVSFLQKSWLCPPFSSSAPASYSTKVPSSFHPSQWPHTILMIPCFAEPADTLKQTLDSLSRSTYDDSRKLLLFVCDGVIKDKTEQRETHTLLLEYLGYSRTEEPQLRAYHSLGQHHKRINYARVYSGFYETGRYRVPYLVIVKVGQPKEELDYYESHLMTAPPGNRGKRDSVVFVFGFLERCMNLASNRITPLEYEIFNQCYNVLGIDPRCFKYIMVTDANIQVQNDVVQKLVLRLEQDQRMLAVSGHVRPANPEENLTTMLQVFPLYISFYSVLSFEACLKSVMTINGGLVMYKIWTENTTQQHERPSSFQKWENLQEGPTIDLPKLSDDIIVTNPFQDPVVRRKPSGESTTTMTTSTTTATTTTTTTNNRQTSIESIFSERKNQHEPALANSESRLSLPTRTTTNIRLCCVHPTVLRGISIPQADTMHMQNVLLQGEDKLLSIVLLKSNPNHRLGFEPDAIGYATLPTHFFSLQELQIRSIRAKFHTQLEMQRVSWQLGYTYWILSTIELLDMMFSMPIICYLYSILGRSVKQYGMAYMIITCSFTALIALHILFFLLRRQYRYIFWFILYCVLSLPLFNVWFPVLAIWKSNDAHHWYNIWPTMTGGRTRLHGIIDPNHDCISKKEIHSSVRKNLSKELVNQTLQRAQRNDEDDFNSTIDHVDTISSVPRLMLADYETAEIRRLHLAAEAALDSNFVGFTGFTDDDHHMLLPSPTRVPPYYETDRYMTITTPPPMVQLRDGVHSTRIIPNYKPSSTDLYYNSPTLWKKMNHSYPNSKDDDLMESSIMSHHHYNNKDSTIYLSDNNHPYYHYPLLYKGQAEYIGEKQHQQQHHKTSYSESSHFTYASVLTNGNINLSSPNDRIDDSTLPSNNGFIKNSVYLTDSQQDNNRIELLKSNRLSFLEPILIDEQQQQQQQKQHIRDELLQDRSSILSISSNTFSIHTYESSYHPQARSTHLPRHRIIALNNNNSQILEEGQSMIQVKKEKEREDGEGHYEGRSRAIHKIQNLQQQLGINTSNLNLRQQYDNHANLLGHHNSNLLPNNTKLSKPRRLKKAIANGDLVSSLSYHFRNTNN